jgi:hypothetical protein
MKLREITGGGANADKVRGKEPMPAAKKRGKHPFKGRLVGEEQVDEIAPAVGAAAKWLIAWAVKRGAWAVLKWILKKYWKQIAVGTVAYKAMQEGWDWVNSQIGEEMTQMLIDNKFEIGMAVALIIGGVALKRFFEKKGDALAARYAESISETTSAGGIAAVAMPMGTMQRRGVAPKRKAKKKK